MAGRLGGVLVLFGAWQASVLAAVLATWSIAAARKEPAPILVRILPEESASKFGGREAERGEPVKREEIGALKRRLAQLSAERDSLGGEYLKLALAGLCNSTLKRPSVVDARSRAWDASTDSNRSRIADVLDEMDAQGGLPNSKRRFMDSRGGWDGSIDEARVDLASRLLGLLGEPAAVDDLLTDPDLLDRVGDLLAAIREEMSPLLDMGAEELNNILARLPGGLGQNLSRLQPVMNLLSRLQDAEASGGVEELTSVMSRLAGMRAGSVERQHLRSLVFYLAMVRQWEELRALRGRDEGS